MSRNLPWSAAQAAVIEAAYKCSCCGTTRKY
jgi:hypothetical protein